VRRSTVPGRRVVTHAVRPSNYSATASDYARRTANVDNFANLRPTARTDGGLAWRSAVHWGPRATSGRLASDVTSSVHGHSHPWYTVKSSKPSPNQGWNCRGDWGVEPPSQFMSTDAHF